MRCLNILDHKVFERCPPAGDGEGVQVEEQQAQVFFSPLFHGPLRRFLGSCAPRLYRCSWRRGVLRISGSLRDLCHQCV